MSNISSESKIKSVERYLIFKLKDESYGIDISKIKEISAPVHITSIPNIPNFIKGIINLRGRIIPIVDLSLKFNLDEKQIDLDTAFIIYEVKDIFIGFIVDRVEDVITIKENNISKTPELGSSADIGFIEKIAEVGNDVVMLLNLEHIFDSEELSRISKLNKNKSSQQPS